MTDPQDRAAAIRARLAEISGGEPTGPERELLARLLRSWLTKTPAAVDRLAGLLEQEDIPAIRDQAHALKGSATNLGITALAGLFAAIEQEARTGRRPDPHSTLAAVRQEYATVEPICAGIAADLSTG
ncbi:Hpt domain-containing protein [Actinoplanes sp. NPDC049265]|uniref:Hpt domain-containing protein n=1 Tax=Actinoplanes sp. NPDC049265 TaxID=3363902 RepID=UPI00371C019E